MVLPSISEDDENQSDAESKHAPSPSKSLIRSPLHGSPSPRHGKFLQRYGRNTKFSEFYSV